MTDPYAPSENPLLVDPYAPDESQQLAAYSILDPSQFTENVAFWSDPATALQPQPLQPPPPQLMQRQQQQQQQQQQPQPHSTITPSGLPSPVTPYVPSEQFQQRPAQQAAPDQKKHKRTRSGCFTCRSRRIKCDEARPICERCRKGNRDCVYPSPASSSSKSGARSHAKSKGSGVRSQASGSPGHGDNDEPSTLSTIVDDEDEYDQVGESGSKTRVGPAHRKNPSTPQSLRKAHKQSVDLSSSSPSTEPSPLFDTLSTRSGSVGATQDSSSTLGTASHLSEDLRFYLIYHQEVLTFRHYLLKDFADQFVHQTMTELALQYEPLLYAVVGFAAYHHCVETGNGRLRTFLKYYNKALLLLRESLGSREKHSEATLVTVLVLTTFEELSGDWASLVSHHQAAHVLTRELLTPESINTNDLHSSIFKWHARFDVVAGILAGNEAVLTRDWYVSKENHDAQQAALHPHDVQKQIDFAASINRLAGLDMSLLYAKLSRGAIPFDKFMIQNTILGQDLDRMRDVLIAVGDPEHLVHTFSNQQPLTDEDPFDPYIPGILYQGPLWRLNFAWIDYLSTKAMYLYQTFRTLQQPLTESENLALKQCQLLEAISRFPHKENGYFLSFSNCMGISCLILPKDEKHIMWARRKLVQMEQNGYITATRYRAGLAEQWNMPELNDWWLPNDEGYPDIVREVRVLTDERANNPQDNFRESLRDMKTLFGKVNLDDSTTESEQSTPSGPPTGGSS